MVDIYKHNRKKLELAITKLAKARNHGLPKTIRQYANQVAALAHIVREMRKKYNFK